MFDSLLPHGPQHTRLFCPPLSPGIYSNKRKKDILLMFLHFFSYYDSLLTHYCELIISNSLFLCLFPIFLCGYFFTLISKSSLPSKDCEILSFVYSIFPQFFIFLVYANHFFLFWFRNCLFYLFQVDSFSSVIDVYACQAAHDYKNIYPCFILGLS